MMAAMIKSISWYCVWCSLWIMLLPSKTAHGFGFHQQRQQRTSRCNTCLYISMISFGGDNNSNKENKPIIGVSLPRDVKEAVSKCRAATQEALKSQISRMDIEFPVGTKFGVEKTKKTKSSPVSDAPTKTILDQSDRELARLFVEMFQPVGGDHLCVVFNDQGLADLAKKQWKDDAGASCRFCSVLGGVVSSITCVMIYHLMHL